MSVRWKKGRIEPICRCISLKANPTPTDLSSVSLVNLPFIMHLFFFSCMELYHLLSPTSRHCFFHDPLCNWAVVNPVILQKLLCMARLPHHNPSPTGQCLKPKLWVSFLKANKNPGSERPNRSGRSFHLHLPLSLAFESGQILPEKQGPHQGCKGYHGWLKLNHPRKLQHTPRAHPRQRPRSPAMKGIFLFCQRCRFQVLVNQRCVEPRTLD